MEKLKKKKNRLGKWFAPSPRDLLSAQPPDGRSSCVEDSRGLARAQRPRQAFPLLICGDSLTNAAVWHQDGGGWKDVSGPVSIQELMGVFPDGGRGKQVHIHLLFRVDKPLRLGKAPPFTTRAEFTATF